MQLNQIAVMDDWHTLCNLVTLLLVVILENAFGKVVPTDYCFREVFEPQCKENEVVLIETALYGRLRMGKCTGTNSEKIGCYTNVLKLLDSLCSGRQSCVVRAAHPDLLLLDPCNSDALPSYLSVSYSCISVQPLSHICRSSQPIEITSSKGYLTNSMTQSQNCPIILKSGTGGQFNISIFNFMKPKDKPACYEVAVVKDTDAQKSLHVCENDPRMKYVHLSTSSAVEIKFTQSKDPSLDMHFLMYFKVIGCPSPPVPANGHAVREGSTATIVCNNSDTTWTTTCKDNKWTESDKECPTRWTIADIVKSSRDFPYGIFLTSIIGVSLGVLIGGFLLFLAINAFHRYQRREHYNPPPVIPDPDYKIYDTARMDLPFVPGYGHSTLPRHQMAAADDAPSAPPPLSEATMKRLSRHTYERPNFPPPP